LVSDYAAFKSRSTAPGFQPAAPSAAPYARILPALQMLRKAEFSLNLLEK
jgi:hypothetical protein